MAEMTFGMRVARTRRRSYSSEMVSSCLSRKSPLSVHPSRRKRWVKLPLLWLIAFTGSSAPAQRHAPEPIRDPQAADRAYIAATAYHAIKRYFAHAEALPANYDFEAHYRAYLRDALAAPSRRDFSLATMLFFASLENGHTSFTDSALSTGAASVPFRVNRIDGRWTIISSKLATLQPGDVIVTVDKAPVDAWIASFAKYIGGSNKAAVDRLIWFQSSLLPTHFTLGLENGQRVPIDLTPSKDMIGASTPSLSTQTIHRPDGVTIIRIPSFENPKFEDDAVAAIAASPPARPIMFDVRGNSGGTTPSKLLAAIMTAPYRGTLVATPMTIAVNDARAVFSRTLTQLPSVMMRYGPEVTAPRESAWKGRMAVLTNGDCASACEDFVMRFQDGKRGPVLGETTFGSTGQPYFVRFPEFAMSFRVSTKREYLPDGHQFEGVGIVPDVAIPLTRAELRRRDDDQLDRAVLAWLKRTD